MWMFISVLPHYKFRQPVYITNYDRNAIIKLFENTLFFSNVIFVVFISFYC